MREKFKLKHLNILTEEDDSKRDLSILMVDILDYKNSIFGRVKWFVKNFVKIKSIVKEVNDVDYAKIELNEDSTVRRPSSINDISYLAMLDLQRVVSQDSCSDISEHIAKVISIATHDENRFTKYYDNSKLSNDSFQNMILEQPMFDMIAIYNWILGEVEKTSKEWEKLFMSVEVRDKDLDSVGGGDLSQFNVINTIKSNCLDFNVSEKEAWGLSYNLTITNNYSKAYSGYLQEQIRVKQEAKIEAKRKKQF
tara:strand:+ start:472 stop:1227 length:756 start_codon:yes stop_codon:yes gene_type:complete